MLVEKLIVASKMCMLQSIRHEDQYSDDAAIFLKDKENFHDRARPGQEHVVITQETITAGESFMRNNRRFTIFETADEISINKRSVHEILQERLQYRKVWIFFMQSIHHLVDRWNTSFLREGNYVKLICSISITFHLGDPYIQNDWNITAIGIINYYPLVGKYIKFAELCKAWIDYLMPFPMERQWN